MLAASEAKQLEDARLQQEAQATQADLLQSAAAKAGAQAEAAQQSAAELCECMASLAEARREASASRAAASAAQRALEDKEAELRDQMAQSDAQHTQALQACEAARHECQTLLEQALLERDAERAVACELKAIVRSLGEEEDT